MASTAATLTCGGVGKSGSPAPRSTTSTPSRRRRSASAATFIVGEVATADMRAARRGAERTGCGSSHGPSSNLTDGACAARAAKG